MVYNFFDKKTAGGAVTRARSETLFTQDKYAIENKELAEELYKTIIRKFEKQKVHSYFINNIWGPDLVDMQLLSTFNKRFRFLLCGFDIYSKYALFAPLKNKRCLSNEF